MNNQQIYPQEISRSGLSNKILHRIHLLVGVHNMLPQIYPYNHGSKLMMSSTQSIYHYILLTLNVTHIKIVLT